MKLIKIQVINKVLTEEQLEQLNKMTEIANGTETLFLVDGVEKINDEYYIKVKNFNILDANAEKSYLCLSGGNVHFHLVN